MTSPQGRIRPQHPAEHRVVDLLATFGLDVRGGDIAPSLSLTGVSVASGDVQPGDVFIALGGAHAHGATYACAKCGKRGAREHMVPQTHEGAVSYYCSNCG